MFSVFAFFFSSSHSNVPFSGGMFSMEDISGGRLVRSTPSASGATRGRLLSKKRKDYARVKHKVRQTLFQRIDELQAVVVAEPQS